MTNAPDIDEIKDRLDAEIEQRAGLLVDVSHRIHAHPELNFEERYAHDALCDLLEAESIATTRHAHGVDTAFVGTAGAAGPNVAVLLEYDALPGIGHACGHNIIAAAGLGAGLAAATVSEECGGRLSIIGTPAEEGGGGKVFLLRAGAFDDVDAALMVHPAGAELRRMSTIAIRQCFATYTGEAAHAAAAPERGRNALDAAVLGYVNVAALRQHIAPDERIHGVFTDGGDKPNIVPARAQTNWFIRSPTVVGRQELEARVVSCLEAGAAAAGCDIVIDWVDPPYADMIDNDTILDAYVVNARRAGRDVGRPEEAGHVVGSTDMGDVSYAVPAIHPIIQAADPGVPIHTAAFTGFACGPQGDSAVIDGAKALAATIVDLWLRPDLLERAKAEHRAALDART